MPNEALEARRAIEAAYARLGTALSNKDVDAIGAIYAPGYRELQPGGDERDLAEVMTAWKADLAAMLDPSLLVEIDRLDLDGAEATVFGRSTQSFTSAPAPSLKYSVRIETIRRDGWTKSGDGWRLRRSESHVVKSWANGNLAHEQILEPPLTADERAAVVRELRVHALPFETVLAGNGFADLAGLDQVIGDARIVALGEASHGTAEFFQMKHRLLEYLVETKGFTVFAIEGNWPEAELADRYVKGGEGDAATALAAMYFWTWQTVEVRAMLDWMRAYNAERGARPVLSFSGFDMQFAAVAIQRAVDLLGGVSSVDGEAARQLYDGIEKWLGKSQMDVSKISDEEKTRLRNNAGRALDLVEARREAFLKASPPEAFRDARQAARIVVQGLDMRASVKWGERDRAMADNVRWLLEERFPGEKIVLWAHNGHLGTGLHGGEMSQGMHLRERYGDQMVVLGFASHQGEIRAKRMAEGKFQPGPPGALPLAPARKPSVEALFYETGLPRFILEFRRIPKDSALGGWLAKPKLHRSIGSVHDPDRPADSYAPTNLPETYDGIIFIAESTAAVALKD